MVKIDYWCLDPEHSVLEHKSVDDVVAHYVRYCTEEEKNGYVLVHGFGRVSDLPCSDLYEHLTVIEVDVGQWIRDRVI